MTDEEAVEYYLKIHYETIKKAAHAAWKSLFDIGLTTCTFDEFCSSNSIRTRENDDVHIEYFWDSVLFLGLSFIFSRDFELFFFRCRNVFTLGEAEF